MLEIERVSSTSFAVNDLTQTNLNISNNINTVFTSDNADTDALVSESVISSTVGDKLKQMQREMLEQCFAGCHTQEAVEVNDGNLNTAVSIVQEFHEIAEALEEKLRKIAEFVESLSNKDFMDGSEDTAFLQKMRTSIRDLNLSAKATPVKDNSLLGEGGHDIQISRDDGSFIVLKAEDFSVNIETEDLTTTEGIESFIASLHEKIKFITDYDNQLQDYIQSLSSINTYLELEIAGNMAMDFNEISPGIASEIAAVAASQIIEQAVPDLNYDIDATRIAGLLRRPLI
jgi:hypothetical protein